MHPQQIVHLLQFFSSLPHIPNISVLEVGCHTPQGTARAYADKSWTWICADIESGGGVGGPGYNVTLSDPHKLPLQSESVDIVIAASTFEHVEFFWLMFTEMVRVARHFIYIIAPSSWPYHAHPIDSWRFMDDAAGVLARWAHVQGRRDVEVLESFVDPIDIVNSIMMSDTVMLFAVHGSRMMYEQPLKPLRSLRFGCGDNERLEDLCRRVCTDVFSENMLHSVRCWAPALQRPPSCCSLQSLRGSYISEHDFRAYRNHLSGTQHHDGEAALLESILSSMLSGRTFVGRINDIYSIQ
eukprot:TRINITY_DN26417_c0_g3_i1.p1 TRINITY_DN26417_c0_g3~~TRINITY_DN26417_c0_g3_i1.p1  ORF type:complete len:297 (+),score=30.69 TRINITY_DN26417_c0_g3_i1:174-1064(+)